MGKTALLIGASGLVGGHCLQYLLEAEQYDKVRILLRRKLAIEHPKLEQHLIDFDALSAYAELIKGDDVFSCLGTTIRKAGSQAKFRKVDYEYPLQIAKIALQNGSKQLLLVSSLGADARSFVFYSRVKGELDEAVQSLPFEQVHILRPSLLLGDRKEFRWKEHIGTLLYKMFRFLLIGPLKKYEGIEASTVAKKMVELAQNADRGIFVYESDEIKVF